MVLLVLLIVEGVISAKLDCRRRTVPQGLPKIHSVSEPPEAAAHHKQDEQDDNQDARQTHSPGSVIAAAVAIKPASAEQQNQQYNQ
jgi:hypothetical protein